jgi:hypothetical protein
MKIQEEPQTGMDFADIEKYTEHEVCDSLSIAASAYCGSR